MKLSLGVGGLRSPWLKGVKVLLAAWPGIPERHRQDYDKLTDLFEDTDEFEELIEVMNSGDLRSLSSDATTWPYINIEDLIRPTSLLIFLNARGRNAPSAFASTELDFSPLRVNFFGEDEPELPEYLLHFSLNPTPAEYGTVHFKEDFKLSDARNEKGFMLELPIGLPILQIQKRILNFLLACARSILHDMAEDILLTSPVQDEPPSSELELRSDFGYLKFSDTSIIAPYRNRGMLDFTRLREYLGGLYTDARDHIWALREDPLYFAETFLDNANHSNTMIPDSEGRLNPSVDTAQHIVLQAREIVSDVYLCSRYGDNYIFCR